MTGSWGIDVSQSPFLGNLDLYGNIVQYICQRMNWKLQYQDYALLTENIFKH